MTAILKIQHVALILATDRNPHSLKTGDLRLEVQETSLSVRRTCGGSRPTTVRPRLGCAQGRGRQPRTQVRGYTGKLCVLNPGDEDQAFPLYRHTGSLTSPSMVLPTPGARKKTGSKLSPAALVY